MTSTFRYTNPINNGDEIAMRDYQILKVGDVWYMTGTSLPAWTGPNPGVKLFVSSDLLNWTFDRWLIDASILPDDCFYNGRFWAPEIHQAHGKFWLTVNSGNGLGGNPRLMDDHGIVLFVADAVTGPYELVREGHIGKGFKNDASLFTDDDGRSYIYCSAGGLWQSEIDLSTATLIGGDDLVKFLDTKDPANPDWMIGGIEGPFAVKRNGVYLMIFSAWTRGYETGLLTAQSPLGPWSLAIREPLFGSRKRKYREEQMRQGGYDHLQFDDTPDPYAEAGHCALFQGPDGNDWISCHYLLEDSETSDYQSMRFQPQLGIEPLKFDGQRYHIDGPTWTEQVVEW